ncbi:MAG: hypothetical protein NT080_08595 [Spirochaetes bacterium]|nr:hypothetical protein [Spirochaetota bacterium]
MAASKLVAELVGKDAVVMINGDSYYECKILALDPGNGFIKLQNKEQEGAKPTWYPFAAIGYIIE